MARCFASLTLERPLAEIDIQILIEQCIYELNKYRHGERSNEQYGLELFRRARQGDQDAWYGLQQCFSETMLIWLRRHPQREVATHLDNEDTYIALAFERFWIATAHNQKLEFSTLASALDYLHASLNGAVCDAVRSYARRKEAPLPESGFAEEPFVEDDDESNELLTLLQDMFSSERERRIVYLLFHCGLKPRDIVRYCPQEFDDVREIYRLRRNIMDRLSRNIDQLRWRLGIEKSKPQKVS